MRIIHRFLCWIFGHKESYSGENVICMRCGALLRELMKDDITFPAFEKLNRVLESAEVLRQSVKFPYKKKNFYGNVVREQRYRERVRKSRKLLKGV